MGSIPREWLLPLGWSLVHFLWQGALVAGLLALALRRIPARDAERRYLASCASLALASLLPLATFVLLLDRAPAGVGTAVEVPSGVLGESMTSSMAVAGGTPESLRAAAERWFPQVVLVWLAGVGLFGGRLLYGWCRLQNLRFRYVRPVEAALRRRLEEIAASLGIHRPVWLLESAIAPVPAVIGWLRPVILLPTSALTGLTPQQLELVLAHELAHVRRHDYIVNLLQSALEVLFFYHPATWWISARIREEREHACDDMAIGILGHPEALGRALAKLESLRPAPAPRLAVAATGGSLYARVARLVLPGTAPGSVRTPLPFLLALAFLLPMVMPVAAPHRDGSADSQAIAERVFMVRKKATLSLAGGEETLAEALAKVTTATGLQFSLPAGAAEQRVRFDFDGVSAGMAIQATFNLLEMDYKLDGTGTHLTGSWWPGSGPRPEAIRHLSVGYFHQRQTMFLQLKHEVAWGQDSPIPMERALAKLTELTGLRFALSEEFRHLPVRTGHAPTTARGVLNDIARTHGLEYRYEDDSTISFRRAP